MARIWIAAEDGGWAESLAVHLRPLADTLTGALERGNWREAQAPDLVIWIAADSEAGATDLERGLDFLASVPHPQCAPQPLIYIEPASGNPPAALVESLVDDRRVICLPWPMEPDEVASWVEELLDAGLAPLSLRDRARRDWVRDRVELLYANLDLPALRQAVNPRNAERPVFLFGERGTRRALLARYIQDLAEPVRERLVALPAAELAGGDLEARLRAACGHDRVTIHVMGVDQLERGRQEGLAEWLGSSGALADESVRWVLSALRPAAVARQLREIPAIRVQLPPLRSRTDVIELAEALGAEGRPMELTADARSALRDYRWPGNLAELETRVETALGAGGVVDAASLGLAPAADATSAEAPAAFADENLAAVTSIDDLTEATLEVLTPAESLFADVEAEQDHYDEIAQRELEPLGELEDEFEENVEADREAEPEAVPALEAEPEPEPEPEEEESVEEEEPAEAVVESAPAGHSPELGDLVPAVAQEIRDPLRAIRTFASLVDQRPDDADRRRELAALLENDLGRVEQTLTRLETYSGFDAPQPVPFDLANTVASELEKRRDQMRASSLVVLRELDHDAPEAVGDEEQVRFSISALFDRALRMVPERGDLYVGTKYHPAEKGRGARHRLLIRFHSPEEVLVGPDDGPNPRLPIEVMLARELIERSGGAFAVDASGAQDNVILIEVPGR